MVPCMLLRCVEDHDVRGNLNIGCQQINGTHQWGMGEHVFLAPGSEYTMFAAVCRLVRISRERRNGNFRRYEGGMR